MNITHKYKGNVLIQKRTWMNIKDIMLNKKTSLPNITYYLIHLYEIAEIKL